MKSRELISLLGLNPVFSPINLKKKSGYLGEDEDTEPTTIDDNDRYFAPKNLVSISNQYDEIYYYSPYRKQLYILKIETNSNEIQTIKYQELKIDIDYNVYKIQLSENARYLCLIGDFRVGVVDLNPSIRSSFFSNGIISVMDEIKSQEYKPLECIYHNVDSSMYKLSQMGTVIKQAEWHPLSNIHLVVLYSNNLLKIFNIQKDCQEAEQIYSLGNTIVCNSFLRQYDTLRQTTVTPDTSFTSFCFGPDINYWTRFTVFLSDDKSNIYYICPIIPNNCLVESTMITTLQTSILEAKEDAANSQNPLMANYYDTQFKWLISMTNSNTTYEFENKKWIKFIPSSYGVGNNRFNAILQGPIYTGDGKNSNNIVCSIHSIAPRIHLFDNEKDKPVGGNQLVPFSIILLLSNSKAIITLSCQDTLPMWAFNEGVPLENKSFEFLELNEYELLDFSQKKVNKVSRNYLSYSHPSALVDQLSTRIYLYHNSGVHCADLTWLTQLFHSINNYTVDVDQSSSLDNMEPTRLISVIDTVTVDPTKPSPIIGLALFNDIKIGNYLISITNTSSSITVDLEGLQYSGSIDDEETTQANQEINYKSPLKPLLDNPPPPIPRLSIPPNHTLKDTLFYIIKAKQNIFAYHSSLGELEAVVKSRLESLKRITKEQQNQLTDLKTNIIEIRNNQNKIQEKMTMFWKQQELYGEQLTALTQIENEGKPLSKAELELKKELQNMVHKVNIYKDKLNFYEKTKSKELQKQQQQTPSKAAFQISNEHYQQINQSLNDQERLIDSNNDQVEMLLNKIKNL